ncbi:MAG: hydantoinase/oxoprolinase N-terminal domain-containing protein, partial [Alphaproteobacteria bacterium]
MSYRLGIDIGGTFTDFALLSERDGRMVIHKQLTTPADPSRSVLTGIPVLLDKAGVRIDQVHTAVHGTTLVTNAVIERRGAATGILCSKGFADIFDIARERRYDMYDLRITYPKALVPRRRRAEIDERVAADGAVSRAIDLAEARGAIAGLIAEHGIEALAVCFLNS